MVGPKKTGSGRQDDRLWKAVLEHVFSDFLKFFYPNDADLFDFSREFEYWDKELDELFPEHRRGRNRSMRYVDKLVKVFLKDGSERFILCHIEVQSHKGRGDLARRMADYYIRLREKYKVPITAIAILADGNKSYRPSVYEEGLLGTRLSYEFTSYKILDEDEAALRADPNPFAVVVLTALTTIKQPGADDGTLYGIKRDLYFEMKARRMPKYTRAGIYDFLKYYVSFEDTNQFAIFESETAQLEGRSTEAMGTTEYLVDRAERRGIDKGIEKERARAKRLIEQERAKAYAEKLRSATKMKNSGFDNAMIADMLELPIEEVEKL